jgi:hypothetical protein
VNGGEQQVFRAALSRALVSSAIKRLQKTQAPLELGDETAHPLY